METIKRRAAEKSTWFGAFTVILLLAQAKYPEYAQAINAALGVIGAAGIATPDTQHPVQNSQ